jgi:hypothetical protein
MEDRVAAFHGLCQPRSNHASNLKYYETFVLSKEPNWVRVSFLSSEDGNRYCFRNVAFYIYLEFRMIDTVHKASDFECYTQSSEPFRFYLFRPTCFESPAHTIGGSVVLLNGSSVAPTISWFSHVLVDCKELKVKEFGISGSGVSV